VRNTVSAHDPVPGTGGAPWLRAAAELALADAGLVPSGIDVVFADAAGRPPTDREEAEAITDLTGLLRECAGEDETTDLNGEVLDVSCADLGRQYLGLVNDALYGCAYRTGAR
jgi:hypothetical protein